MRFVCLCCLLFTAMLCFGQDEPGSAGPSTNPGSVTKGFILKSNVANLIFLRPTLSIEKFVASKLSLEASVIPGLYGTLIGVGKRKRTETLGFLLRSKFFFEEPVPGSTNVYLALYGGTHRRYRKFAPGDVLPDITESYSYRINSLRGGGSVGCHIFGEKRMIVDTQASLGYGHWLNWDPQVPGPKKRGYFDFQLWVCLGYHF